MPGYQAIKLHSMRIFFLFAFCFLLNHMHGQQNNAVSTPLMATGDSVTVIAVFNKMNLTKDGYYVADYVVEISTKEAKKWDGKKVKITGILNIVSGPDQQTPQLDDKGNRLVVQGRAGDTKHIVNPVIRPE